MKIHFEYLTQVSSDFKKWLADGGLFKGMATAHEDIIKGCTPERPASDSEASTHYRDPWEFM